MGNYIFDIHSRTTQTVGKLNVAAIKQLLGVNFPVDEVNMYPGAIKHVQREHPGIIETYGHLIPDMLWNPDYIGKHPSVPNSIELYKYISPNLLLAVKLDPSGYLYVSSFYDLKNASAKIQKRLASGRIQAYNP